ncbi:MAG: HesA/MoeB/ThiF family protein [Pseudomonadota bacterium]
MNECSRYSRQTTVAQIGTRGQEQLSKSTVLIVGAGGLGCQVGAQLAGAGIGEIRLVDHDTVELSNLHRQVLFTEADIGKAKAEVACAALQARNSNIQVTAISQRLALDNVEDLISNVDLVIDAADNFATSYVLSDACLERALPLLSASVNRTFGYLGVFCGGDRDKPIPSMRAVFPRLPKQSLSCDVVGVTGPSVAVIASLQAQEAIKLLIGADNQLEGKLLYCDLWNYSQHTVDFSSAKEPGEQQIRLINQAALTDNDYVVDVRNPEEINAEPQAFATHLHIPLPELLEGKGLELSERTERIVLACKSGQRALVAAQIMLDRGVAEVAAILPDSR